jgi:hypothetical protein
MSVEDNKIVCPNGHSNKFVRLHSMSTAMGYGPSIVDGNGKVIQQAVDPNIHTTTYRCFDCGAQVEVKHQYGKRIK